MDDLIFNELLVQWLDVEDSFFSPTDAQEVRLLDDTPPRFLLDLIHACVHEHSTSALYWLLLRAKQLSIVSHVMSCIACTPRCGMCRSIRSYLLPFLLDADVLAGDFALVRHELARDRALKLDVMRKPLMLLDAATDAVAAHIFSVSKCLWGRVMFAVYAKIMWTRWLTRQLHPDSRYIRGLGRRFYDLL